MQIPYRFIVIKENIKFSAWRLAVLFHIETVEVSTFYPQNLLLRYFREVEQSINRYPFAYKLLFNSTIKVEITFKKLKVPYNHFTKKQGDFSIREDDL